MAQMVKNLPATHETWVRSLGWEDPLEERMATHSSVLAWRIPMDRGAWRAVVHGVAKILTGLSEQAQRKNNQRASQWHHADDYSFFQLHNVNTGLVQTAPLKER